MLNQCIGVKTNEKQHKILAKEQKLHAQTSLKNQGVFDFYKWALDFYRNRPGVIAGPGGNK